METLQAYWSESELQINGLILLHLLGAAAVGMMLGYERSYHGRAAGIRTYTLVCVGSTVLTVISAYPTHWFGGQSNTPMVADPTHIIQGILTGIGFLGAGVIMKEGFTIRGLSTAASLWMTATIGIVIGVGFYGAAISAAILAIVVMGFLKRLEYILPHQSLLHLSLSYSSSKAPQTEAIAKIMLSHGFYVRDWAFHLSRDNDRLEYQVVLQSTQDCKTDTLAAAILQMDDIVEFKLSPSHN